MAFGLYEESGNRTQIVTASGEAMDHGIHPEMPLAEAQALLDSAEFMPHDEQADLMELQMLARVCCLYSPLVSVECSGDSHCLVLDISGCAPLFGSEFRLARRLIVDLAKRGYFVHVATADTIGAAWAIARYGHRAGSNRYLRSLPVEALRIPPQLVASLGEFDLRTIGQLRLLRKDALPSRFGTMLTERLDQMFGHREELPVPVAHPEPVLAEWSADESICHREAIRCICTDLLSEILGLLKARGKGLLKLTLTLQSEASDPLVLEIGLTRPADSLPHLMGLVELKMETEPVPEWLHTIRMEASVMGPLEIRQRTLFTQQESIRDDVSVQRLIDRLSTRIGPQAVVRPALLPQALPEQAVGYEPLADQVWQTQSASDSPTVPVRPLELFPEPQPVDVMSVVPDGPPVTFHWNQREYRIAHCTEFERIKTGWWQDSGSIHRDYCRVETQSGSCYWLFRDGNGKWLLHGVFE